MEKHTVLNYTILWKPLAALGVPLDYLVIALFCSGVCSVLYSIFFHNILGYPSGGLIPYILFFLGFFGYGRIRFKDDPEFMSIYLTRIKYMKKTKGSDRGNVYHP